ncbi:hypothetical protein [Desertihabitans aurantiacus]|uniref:hypothetical protein n=1 Tax=Desertihabitans aurantiacus TaxID=2282477 RepID=UPI000DF743D5|nr:hypothetical protein [Desertihabitans aurantiacus]
MTAGGWHWQALPEATPGFVEAGGRTVFPTRADAEAWVSEVWPELLEAGVLEVSLFEDDRLVYGPMGLTAD